MGKVLIVGINENNRMHCSLYIIIPIVKYVFILIPSFNSYLWTSTMDQNYLEYLSYNS